MRGQREIQEGGDICIHKADSLHCTAETNTTLKSNYTAIKKKKFVSRGGSVVGLANLSKNEFQQYF